MFPFAESARAHVKFAGAHHNGYTLHTALFSHEKFPPPESLLFLFKKKKNTVHTWEPNTQKSRMKSVRSSVFSFFLRPDVFTFFSVQRVRWLNSPVHTVRHVIIIFFFFWVCVVTFFAFFYRVLRPSFFLFLCRVAAGAPCPAVTSSFFFFQAIKVSFFYFLLFFTALRSWKIRCGYPPKRTRNKRRRKKKKKPFSYLFLFRLMAVCELLAHTHKRSGQP